MCLLLSIFAANIQYFHQYFFLFSKKTLPLPPNFGICKGMTSRTTTTINRWAASLCFGVCLTSCCSAENNGIPFKPNKTIVILYENDVHCAIDGYTKLAGLRDAIAASDTAYVGITSSGDFLNGSLAGIISNGQYIVDIMRNVGYDAITLGNHEFDFQGPRMIELLPQIKAPIICANFFEAGAEHPFYPTCTIKTYGQKRIGYVGVGTPSSMQDEYYAFYDKDGNQLYDFRPNDVVALVQQSVDNVRRAGADYVVLLSHLGESSTEGAIDSHTLVNNIRGVDVVLDGHTHSVIPHDMVPDLDGKEIPVTQTGTQFAYIGKLVITKDGNLSTSLIPIDDITYTNQHVSATTDSIKHLMESATTAIIGSSDFELTINDSQGDRLVRKGETNLGDLCADAFRECCNADIGLINGGGVRNSIPAGNITLGDAINTIPFYNLTCKIEVTGGSILNMLKACTNNYPQEDGAFPQVAGLKFTLHASSHTITDVQILNRETSQYEPLQSERKYTIGISDYYNSGGFYGTLHGATLLEQTGMISYTALANYIKDTLGGDVSAYSNSQNRILIEY